MRVVPFEVAHLAMLDPPALSTEDVGEFKALFPISGPAFTAIDGDTILGCAGVQIVGDVGHAWAFLSDAIRDRPIPLHRAVVRGLGEIERTHDLRRVVATAYYRFHRAHDWLRRLGFRFERHLPNYLGNGYHYMEFVK